MSERAVTATLCALAALGAVVTAVLLSRHAYLPGTDAYAYVVQARVLVERGHLQFDDGALVLHALTALLSRIVGYEGAVAVLLGVAAWAPLAACAPSVARLVREAPLRAAFITLFAALSPTLWFAAIEVPRQALAVALVPLWIEALRATTSPRALIRPTTLALWLAPVASVLVHRVMLAPALLIVVVAIVRTLPRRARLAALVVPALVLLAGALLVLLMIVRVILERGADVEHLVTGDFGVAERFVLVVPVVVIVVLTLLPRTLLRTRPSPSPSSSLSPSPSPPAHGAQSWGIAVVILGAIVARPLLQPARDLDAEARVIPRLADAELVVARRPLAFLYTARTGKDAFLFEPEAHWDAKRITRVVHGASPSELAHFLDGGCAWERVEGASEYAIVREDCYRALRDRVRAEAERDGGESALLDALTNDAQNPSRARPAFLRARSVARSGDGFKAAPPPPP